MICGAESEQTAATRERANGFLRVCSRPRRWVGLPADLSQVLWMQVFARQCPLIMEADLVTESSRDLWALFLGKAQVREEGQ